jgi:hypothetical protein
MLQRRIKINLTAQLLFQRLNVLKTADHRFLTHLRTQDQIPLHNFMHLNLQTPLKLMRSLHSESLLKEILLAVLVKAVQSLLHELLQHRHHVVVVLRETLLCKVRLEGEKGGA